MLLADLVALMIAQPPNAGRLFVRTLSTVCANWQTDLTGLRLRAKGRMCALSNTPDPTLTVDPPT